MGKMSQKGEKFHDHHLEEQIGVEVKNLLRTEMSGSVAAMEREWNEEERQMFSDAYLSSAVELMIPTIAEERRLMRWQHSGKGTPEPKKKSAKRRKPEKKRPAKRRNKKR